MVIRLAVALLMILSSLVPTGSALCVSRQRGLELETRERPCCATSPQHGETAPAAQQRMGGSCDGCTDFAVADELQCPSGVAIVAPATTLVPPALPPTVVAAWMPPQPSTERPSRRDRLISLRLAEIRTVRIRC